MKRLHHLLRKYTLFLPQYEYLKINSTKSREAFFVLESHYGNHLKLVFFSDVKNYFFKVAKLVKKAEPTKAEGVKPYFDRNICLVGEFTKTI